MGLGEGVKNILGFLTILPVQTKEDSLKKVAQYTALFPLVGLLIGLIVGGVAWALLMFLPGTIVGFLILGVILLITGLHHTDGLLDFGDALMFQGSPKAKRQVMHDSSTGAGGFGLGFIILSLTALSIGYLKPNNIIQALIVSEMAAKSTMVLTAYAGKPTPKGLGQVFIDAVHGKYGLLQLLGVYLSSLFISYLLLRTAGIIGVVTAAVAGLILVYISQRHFKAVTGDVFGAVNEISRMLSLLVIVGVGW